MQKQPTYEELQQQIAQLERTVARHEKVETLLEDEIARWRTLIEQSRDGIVILDRHANVREANSSFAAMLGYSLEEIHQLHVWDWDAQNEKAAILEMVGTVDPSGDHFETLHRRKDGSIISVEISTNGMVYHGDKLIFCVCRDVSERNRREVENKRLIQELQGALAEIKTLKGILPICAFCKKIKVDEHSWEQLETYVQNHSAAEFSHGFCPECAKKHYPEFNTEES